MKHSRSNAPKEAIDALKIVHDGERTKVWDVEYDPNDEWLTELRQGATRRLEELTTYWHGHEPFANDGVFITQTPPITSEAAYHQSMIAEE